MRKLSFFIIALGMGTAAHVQADQQKAFDCLDKQTFEINSQCMADRISQNVSFKSMQSNITETASMQSDSVMATIKYYPKEGIIEVVAHRDALNDKSLTASVRR